MEIVRENKLSIESELNDVLKSIQNYNSRISRLQFRREQEQSRIVQRHIKDFCDKWNLYMEDGTGRLFTVKPKFDKNEWVSGNLNDSTWFGNSWANKNCIISFYFPQNNDILQIDMKSYRLVNFNNYDEYLYHTEICHEFIKIMKDLDKPIMDEYHKLIKRYGDYMKTFDTHYLVEQRDKLKSDLNKIQEDLLLEPGNIYVYQGSYFIVSHIDVLTYTEPHVYYYDTHSEEVSQKSLDELKESQDGRMCQILNQDKKTFLYNISKKKYKPTKQTERKMKIRRLLYV